MDWWYRLNRFLSDHLTPAVKTILFINVGFYLFHFLARLIYEPVANWALFLLADIPRLTIFWLNLWRPLTYMFVHYDLLHLAFNMMMLWVFAPDLESRWGTRRFWIFYLVTGAGAGLLHALIMVIFTRHDVIMVGASGALYGVLLAFATYYPNRMIMIWGVFPVPVKFLAIFTILISVTALQGPPTDNVSHITHLAGLVVAYLYLARYHHTADLTRWKWMN